MSRNTITDKEFDQRFKEFLKTQGPNPGTSFFGAMGWHAAKQEEFSKLLARQGIKVVPINYKELNKGNFKW